MTQEQFCEQLKRLSEVDPMEMWQALDELLEEIAHQLHGTLKEDDNGRKYLSGGYTLFGAHSEARLGGEALYHYQSMVVEKLYDGSCEWKPENTLAEQLKKIANHVITNEVEKYKTQMSREEREGYSSQALSLDEENAAVSAMEDSDVNNRHAHWELICKAADGDDELERYVQAVGESKQLKDVREKLGLKSGETERLQKKLKRRVKKLPYG